jgi:hypothetical protein
MSLDLGRQPLEQLYDRLTDALRRTRPDPFGTPVTVAEIYQELVPYRDVRADLGFGMNADYEHALLRLLAGEADLARLEPAEARAEIARELRSPNPNVSIYREYAGCDVWLAPLAADAAAGASMAETGRAAAMFDAEDDWTVELLEADAEPGAASSGRPHDAAPLPARAAKYGLFELDDDADPAPPAPPAAGAAPPAAAAAPAESSRAKPAAEASRAAPAPAESSRAAPAEASLAAPAEASLAAPAAAPGPAESVPESAAAEASPAPPAGARPVAGGRCAFCDSDLPRHRQVRYCPFCGADQQARPCPDCGDAIEAGWSFCIVCGATDGAA